MGEQHPPRHDEDTQAILDRRRFLIESTLAGAGLGALAAGCDTEKPRPCLSIAKEPQPCLSVIKEPPKKPDTATPPQPCLSPPPEPRPCLEVPAPPKKDAKAKVEWPKACLSVREHIDDK